MTSILSIKIVEVNSVQMGNQVGTIYFSKPKDFYSSLPSNTMELFVDKDKNVYCLMNTIMFVLLGETI